MIKGLINVKTSHSKRHSHREVAAKLSCVDVLKGQCPFHVHGNKLLYKTIYT